MTASLAISILSLIISATALYLTQLRGPRIKCKIGPDLKIYHGHFDAGLSTGIYLPVTFINTAPTAGTVTRAAVAIHRVMDPMRQFLIQWDQFVKMEPRTYNYYAEEHCHSLPVGGKSAAAKIVWFFWFARSEPDLVLEEGAYSLRFLYWQDDATVARMEEAGFYITAAKAAELAGYRAQRSSDFVQVFLDQRFDVNQTVGAEDIASLIR
jgi:hypothetical protein